MAPKGGKFGQIKRQHGRVTGLDAVLDRIIRDCPQVTKIVPGRMGRKRGKTSANLKVQYMTYSGGSPGTPEARPTGLKCIYTKAGSWQEVFMVCSDAQAARQWIEENV